MPGTADIVGYEIDLNSVLMFTVLVPDLFSSGFDIRSEMCCWY